MITQIDEQIYTDPESFYLLDKLVDLFFIGKHIWKIENPEFILGSQWLKTESLSRLGKRVEFLTKATVKTAYIGEKQKSNILYISNFPKQNEYSLHYGYSILNEPLYIIVENENSDRVFIETLCKAYNRKDLAKAISEGWIFFDSEGGSGAIIRKINKHLEKPYRSRLLVVTDSDKEYPEDKNGVGNIENKCQENEINYVILYKRAIENYIPTEALFSLPQHLHHIIEAYKSLNDDQKDFFHMKKGFNGKGKLPPKQEILFNNINSKDKLFNALRNGFTGNGYNPNNLYELFNDENVTKETLQLRCAKNPEEINYILNQISILL
jgi:hypothetical protein